jgi:hypothetical protein
MIHRVNDFLTAVPTQNLELSRKLGDSPARSPYGRPVRSPFCPLSFPCSRAAFARRASLEPELVALRHQVIVLRRQRPDRLRLHSADRLLWVGLAGCTTSTSGTGQIDAKSPSCDKACRTRWRPAMSLSAMMAAYVLDLLVRER